MSSLKVTLAGIEFAAKFEDAAPECSTSGRPEPIRCTVLT